MLKFTGEGKQGTIYFLGLSQGNLDHLVAGQPILVHLADMGGPSVSVALLYGLTEELLFHSLKAQGLIPPDVLFLEAQVGTAEVVRIKREQGLS